MEGKILHKFEVSKDLGGWLFVRGQLRIPCLNCEVYLRIKYGEELNSLRLPVTKRGIINYIFRIDKIPDEVYLITKDEDCTIDIIKEPLIRRISSLEKYYRIYRRVLPVIFSRQKITRELRKRENIKPWEILLKPYQSYQAITWRRFYDIWEQNSYESFLSQLENFYKKHKRAILRKLKNLRYKPKFYVFIPLLDGESGGVEKTVESIKNQIYKNVEIKFIQDACNYSPDGDYYCLIYPGDILPEYAFFCIANFLNKTGSYPEIIYTDHDIIDDMNNRKMPKLKPDWSKEYFMSYNYISSLVLFKKDLLQRIGDFDLSFQFHSEYNKILQALKIKPDIKISHIPMVLYHRSERNQTKVNEQIDLAYKAIKEYFKDSTDVERFEKGSIQGTIRITYKIPTKYPLISIIIPTKNKFEMIKRCIVSILEKTLYHNYEIIIVDNGSTETECLGFYESIKKDMEKIQIISHPISFNFSKLVNFGVSQARGDLICLLNNDTEVLNEEWLTEMLRYAVREDIGAVGCKLLYSDGSIQHAGAVVGIWNGATHLHRGLEAGNPGYLYAVAVPREVSAVTAACMMVKKALFEMVNGFEEEFVVAFNDVDFCLKLLKKGYKNLYTPYAVLFHYESSSRGNDEALRKIADEDIIRLRKKWGLLYKMDPYYNPNLTFYKEDFSLGVPESHWLL